MTTVGANKKINVGKLQDNEYRLPFSSLTKPPMTNANVITNIQKPVITSGGSVARETVNIDYKYMAFGRL